MLRFNADTAFLENFLLVTLSL